MYRVLSQFSLHTPPISGRRVTNYSAQVGWLWFLTGQLLVWVRLPLLLTLIPLGDWMFCSFLLSLSGGLVHLCFPLLSASAWVMRISLYETLLLASWLSFSALYTSGCCWSIWIGWAANFKAASAILGAMCTWNPVGWPLSTTGWFVHHFAGFLDWASTWLHNLGRIKVAIR